MKGILIRGIVIIVAFLLSITWFPYSLLPLWLLVCVMNFFNVREGLILFIGFSLLSLSTGLTWFGISSITILWVAIMIFMAITYIFHIKHLNIPTLFITCIAISFSLQIWAYGWQTLNGLSLLLWTSAKHIVLVGLIIMPAKIFGEAYARYLNALGINYE